MRDLMGCNTPLKMAINPTNFVGCQPTNPTQGISNGQQTWSFACWRSYSCGEGNLLVKLDCGEAKLQTSSEANLLVKLSCCEAKLQASGEADLIGETT